MRGSRGHAIGETYRLCRPVGVARVDGRDAFEELRRDGPSRLLARIAQQRTSPLEVVGIGVGPSLVAVIDTQRWLSLWAWSGPMD